VFKITGAQVVSGATRRALASVSNRLYDVTRATNLATGIGAFVPVPGATNLAPTPPVNTWTDSVSGASAPAFYRLRVHQ
jgi:hypothetical protein